MKWNETEASRYRYGDVIGTLFEGAEVIWERSLGDDYEGSANVLALMPGGFFVHYEWVYGSCSSCDEWEALGLTDEQIRDDVQRSWAVLKDAATLRRYLHLEGEFERARTTTTRMKAGRLVIQRTVFGAEKEFLEMRVAAERWLDANVANSEGA